MGGNGASMPGDSRWLLPEGIEELLPAEARVVERMRRQLLDLCDGWGYELVVPPLVEYTESLLIGLGPDLDLQTFKLTDQLSGRTLGVRPDITPQVARIDAHSLHREGPSRLCYAGSVLHTRARSPLASRSPIQLLFQSITHQRPATQQTRSMEPVRKPRLAMLRRSSSRA